MRILLLTVAGLSSRFGRSVGRPCLKCLYYKNSIEESLLYRMLRRHTYFDRIVIVGGFRFAELKETLDREFEWVKEKLLLVENVDYDRYGSGYSLYVGLEAVKAIPYDELVFAEGDLFVDGPSFDAVCRSEKSVLTYTFSPIYADRSVACYTDVAGKPHYIYDTAHGTLSIGEPFLSVFNSGQIWKFADGAYLKRVMKSFRPEELYGTNLVPINRYFQGLPSEAVEKLPFRSWINCNTVEDFHASLEERN